jgi:hypothetical protein
VGLDFWMMAPVLKRYPMTPLAFYNDRVTALVR